jgi:hypothetical protein
MFTFVNYSLSQVFASLVLADAQDQSPVPADKGSKGRLVALDRKIMQQLPIRPVLSGLAGGQPSDVPNCSFKVHVSHLSTLHQMHSLNSFLPGSLGSSFLRKNATWHGHLI